MTEVHIREMHDTRQNSRRNLALIEAKTVKEVERTE